METVASYSQAFGCATNIFDYYTTWSDAAFLVAIVLIGLLPILKNKFADVFCVAAFANMTSVAIVGHLMANYLNVRADVTSVISSLGAQFTTNAVVRVNYTSLSVSIHDDIGHILPLLGSIIALVFIKSGFRSYRVKFDWSFLWISWLLVAGYITLYLAIPFQQPAEPTKHCEGTSYTARTWWNKLYKVYYAQYLWLACIALLLVPAVVVALLVLVM